MGTQQQTCATSEKLESRRRQICWLPSLNETGYLTSLRGHKAIKGMQENSPWQGINARLGDFEKPDSWNKGLALTSKSGQDSDKVGMAQFTLRREV